MFPTPEKTKLAEDLEEAFGVSGEAFWSDLAGTDMLEPQTERTSRLERRQEDQPVVDVPQKRLLLIGQEPEKVLEEFETLMRYESLKRLSPDTRKRYKMYQKMLFTEGGFQSRADMFAPGAKERAYAFYMNKANTKATKGGKTTVLRLFKNFKRGYDYFVLLADQHSGKEAEWETDWEFIESVLGK